MRAALYVAMPLLVCLIGCEACLGPSPERNQEACLEYAEVLATLPCAPPIRDPMDICHGVWSAPEGCDMRDYYRCMRDDVTCNVSGGFGSFGADCGSRCPDD